MNALFVFVVVVVLSASAVLSATIPTKKTDGDVADPFDDFDQEFKKVFPSSFGVLPVGFNHDIFSKDPEEIFKDIQTRLPLWPKAFDDDYFKNLKDKFKDLKNDTVENVKEVDGHIIHQKERTFSNGDENHPFHFREKTVIIRPKPKNGSDKPVEAGKPVNGAFQPENRGFEYTERPAIGAPNMNNDPDDEVEMINVSRNNQKRDQFSKF